MDNFPELTVHSDGSSGISIKGKLGDKYCCAEYTMSDQPQDILISPWIQFSPAALNSRRLELANEIARRAGAYDNLVKQITEYQKYLENSNDETYRVRDKLRQALDMMRLLVKEGPDGKGCFVALPEGTDVTERLTYKPWVKS